MMNVKSTNLNVKTALVFMLVRQDIISKQGLRNTFRTLEITEIKQVIHNIF
jgi:hypothetical protein